MRMRLTVSKIPLAATGAVSLILYGGASVAFPGFFSAAVFVNFFNDNAVLGIAALGLTFVILAGGIDLSVGSVAGFTSIFLAVVMERFHVGAGFGILAALGLGLVFGSAMGALIHFFSLPPFWVTLAGMFLARGLAFMIQMESVSINQPLYARVADLRVTAGSVEIPAAALFFVALCFLAAGIAQYTRFGRNVYALGGNEQSALLMGVPIARTKIGVYALSGFASALAGVVYSFYTSSGNPTACGGLELDAIAAVVIGGGLLTGGAGYIAGTVLGVLILGIIQTGIMFKGTLSSWWTKIAIGLLLLGFILLQKFLQSKKMQILFGKSGAAAVPPPSKS